MLFFSSFIEKDAMTGLYLFLQISSLPAGFWPLFCEPLSSSKLVLDFAIPCPHSQKNKSYVLTHKDCKMCLTEIKPIELWAN